MSTCAGCKRRRHKLALVYHLFAGIACGVPVFVLGIMGFMLGICAFMVGVLAFCVMACLLIPGMILIVLSVIPSLLIKGNMCWPIWFLELGEPVMGWMDKAMDGGDWVMDRGDGMMDFAERLMGPSERHFAAIPGCPHEEEL